MRSEGALFDGHAQPGHRRFRSPRKSLQTLLKFEPLLHDPRVLSAREEQYDRWKDKYVRAYRKAQLPAHQPDDQENGQELFTQCHHAQINHPQGYVQHVHTGQGEEGPQGRR